jgi:hypothetical protein
MATLERPVDRGARRGRSGLIRIGADIRDARVACGITIRSAAAAAGVSASEWGRIERAAAPWVAFMTLSRSAAVVGLDLSARLYPGPRPFRDSAQLALLAALKTQLHPSLAWATEVPIPIPGDARAWDATVGGPGWRFGVEAETAPRDLQALGRRIHLKQRDSRFDGVILLVRDTRLNRNLLREEAVAIAGELPAHGRRVLAELVAGSRPSGSAIVVLRVPTPHRKTP